MPIIFELFLLIVAIYWDVTAFTTLPLWRGTSIAGGLLPAAISTIMIILIIYRLIKHFRNGDFKKEYFSESFKDVKWKSYLPILIGVAVILLAKVLGLYITLTIMLLLWLRFLSGCGWGKAVLITVIVMAVIYGIFIAWLAVPLPKGILGLI
jgi:hypothetical protein